MEWQFRAGASNAIRQSAIRSDSRPHCPRVSKAVKVSKTFVQNLQEFRPANPQHISLPKLAIGCPQDRSHKDGIETDSRYYPSPLDSSFTKPLRLGSQTSPCTD